MPRKTDANNPADWLWIATSDLEFLRLACNEEVSFIGARSKLAEVLEKVMKAELIRGGWKLVKTHNLLFLAKELRARQCELIASLEPVVEALAEAYMFDRYPGFDLPRVAFPGDCRLAVNDFSGDENWTASAFHHSSPL